MDSCNNSGARLLSVMYDSISVREDAGKIRTRTGKTGPSKRSRPQMKAARFSGVDAKSLLIFDIMLYSMTLDYTGSKLTT